MTNAPTPRWTRRAGVLLLAWALAAVWGSVVQTRWNLQALADVGVNIPAGRSTLLASAAGVGMVAAVRAVEFVTPMPVFIDATRSMPGLLAMAAGAVVAGWLYVRLCAR